MNIWEIVKSPFFVFNVIFFLPFYLIVLFVFYIYFLNNCCFFLSFLSHHVCTSCVCQMNENGQCANANANSKKKCQSINANKNKYKRKITKTNKQTNKQLKLFNEKNKQCVSRTCNHHQIIQWHQRHPLTIQYTNSINVHDKLKKKTTTSFFLSNYELNHKIQNKTMNVVDVIFNVFTKSNL